MGKAIQYANKKEITYVVLLGKEELENKIYKIKNMKTGEETEVKI